MTQKASGTTTMVKRTIYEKEGELKMKTTASILGIAMTILGVGGCAATTYDFCRQYKTCQKDFTATGQYYGGQNPDALNNSDCALALRSAYVMRGAPPSCNIANTPPKNK